MKILVYSQVPLIRGPDYYNITYRTAIIVAEM